MKQDDTTARFDEQLLTAYFSGTATAEEEQALLAWIRSSDDNRRTFAELRAVWQRGRMQRPDTQLQARFVRSLNSLNRRIDALGADAPLRRSRRIPLRRFAAAAIVAVALAAAFMTYRVATAPFVHRFHNADTVAMHVAMPDGTDVWLGPGTSLSYDDTVRVDGRNVELDGEAYFDVTHDEGGAFGIDFFGNPDFRTLEHFLIVGAVDFDDDVLAVGLLVKFNLEVEFGIGHETCLIDRIDLRGRDRCGSECTENADGSQCGGCGAQYEFLHGDVVFLWGRKLARESASTNKWTNGGRER